MNFFVCVDVLANEKTSASDKSYKQVFDYIRNSSWINAENLANKLGDKSLFKIVLSQEFLDTSYKETNFHKITNFLKKNPTWPQNDLLKNRAEHLINGNVEKTEIYNWFRKNPPVTGCGYKYYALAAAQIVTDSDKLTPIIKNAWINGHFAKEEQDDFYNKFKKFLSKEDNVKKVDNLIWKGSIKLAKNSLNLVEAGYKKAFEAQIAFSEMNRDAKKLFRNIMKVNIKRIFSMVKEYINGEMEG